jgi:hypothetical protein
MHKWGIKLGSPGSGCGHLSESNIHTLPNCWLETLVDSIEHHSRYKMHSSLVRIQNVFGFFTTVAFSLGVLIALSVVVSHQNPSAELELRNVQV